MNNHLTLTAVSLLLIGLTMSGTAYSQVPVWEREALIALYNATDGDNWDPHYFGSSEGWDGPAGTECNWWGVTCSSGRVTELNLGYRNQLSGFIPAELGNLTSLIQHIHLEGTQQ